MSFTVVFTCSAKGTALIQQAVIAYLSGLTYNNTRAVVDKQTLAYLSTWVYLDTCQHSCKLRNTSCDDLVLVNIEPVRHPVKSHSVKPRICEDLQRTSCRRISVLYSLNIMLYIFQNRHIYLSLSKKKPPEWRFTTPEADYDLRFHSDFLHKILYSSISLTQTLRRGILSFRRCSLPAVSRTSLKVLEALHQTAPL